MSKEKTLYNLPAGWVWTTLGEIALPVKKINKNYENPNEQLNYIDIEAIDNNRNIIKESKRLTWVKAPSRAQYVVKAGDILFSTVRPNLKNIANVLEQNNDAVASSGFCVIRTSQLNSKYIFYYILSQGFVDTVTSFAKGTSYPAVTSNIVMQQPIPLPPLSIQNSIVDKIDTLFSELLQAEESLKKGLKMLTINRYISLLEGFTGKLTKTWRKQNSAGQIKTNIKDLTARQIKTLPAIPPEWKWKKLGDYAEKISAGSTPKGGRYVYLKSGTPFIRSQNVHFGKLKSEDQVFISAAMNKRMIRSEVKAKDVLLNITGASIGRSAFVPEDFKAGNVNQHVCIIRLGDNVSYKYLSYYLNSSTAQIHINRVNSGATREALTFEQIKNFPFPYCSLEEQNQIVENIEYKLAIFENLQETIEQNLDKINVFRQSILKKAFEGNLVDINSETESADVLLQRIKNYKTELIILLENEAKLLPKKKKIMQEKLTVIEILKKSSKPLLSDEVWQQSSHKSNIDDFYSELKRLIEKNEIKEMPRKGKLSYLTINKQK